MQVFFFFVILQPIDFGLETFFYWDHKLVPTASWVLVYCFNINHNTTINDNSSSVEIPACRNSAPCTVSSGGSENVINHNEKMYVIANFHSLAYFNVWAYILVRKV